MVKIIRLRSLAAVVGLLAAVGLLVLMMLMVEARTAQATFPGKNGKIAYVTLTATSGGEIYTINPDGTGKFRVTNTKNTSEESPNYSPNGKKIAYSGCPNGSDCEIYIVPARGGKPIQVTNNQTNEYEPSFSPDGKKIAYTGEDPDSYEIYTIKATGGKPFKLTNGKKYDTDNEAPSYSPNGKKIAYTGNCFRTSDCEIYKINANGGKPVQVTTSKKNEAALYPSWGSRP